MSNRYSAGLALIAAAGLAACSEPSTAPTSTVQPRFAQSASDLTPVVAPTGDLATFLRALNSRLAAQGARFAVRQADLSFAPTANPNQASIVFANDRRLRTGYRFVTADPRRPASIGVIRQASFAPFAFAFTGSGFVDATPSIDASFATWASSTCSGLPIVKSPLAANVFPSALLSLGPGFLSDPLANDVNTIGYLPGFIFDLFLGPGAANGVLGVTFPFVWVDADGNPTDIDHDNTDDMAFAEIWYNAAFNWTNTGTGSNIDLETVALHENGHALGLDHFGKVAINLSSGKLQVSPRAVMNAFILGTLRSPLGTDNAAYCSLWSNYPN